MNAHRAATHVRQWSLAGTPARTSALCFAGGLISAAAFAPLDAWPVMPVALAGLIWQLDGAPSVRRAAWLGWLFGFGQFFAGLYWIAIAWQFQADMPAIMGWLAVAVLAALLALFSAAACAAAKLLWHPGAGRIAVFAACWTAAEVLRGVLFTGFPWNCVGSAWLGVAPLAQSGALVGVYGLSVLMVLAGGALALLADPPPAATGWLRGLSAGFGMLFLGGISYILLTPISYLAAPQLHIVQANIDQHRKMLPDPERLQLRRHLDLTRTAIAARGPGVVIWPETAVPNLIDEELTTRYLISRALGSKSHLITGADRLVRAPDGTALAAMNSLMVLTDDGSVADVYDKVHLVPFGEYLPWRSGLSALGFSRMVEGRLDYAPGLRLRTLEVSGIPAFGPLVCFEVGFPGAVVGWGPRPAWLLNISNDAWFGRSSGPYQHLALARLRAIEEGLPVVRGTPTGISAVIDPHGRVRARTAFGTPAVLTSQIPAALAPTPFARVGMLLFGLMWASTLAVGLRARPKQLKQRHV